MFQYHRSLRMALAAAVFVPFVAATAPALASDYICKDEIKVTGNGAITEWGARKKAKLAWRDAAIVDYGIFYADEENANEGNHVSIMRCARSGIFLMRCEVRGRPCVEQTELECTRNEGQDCDPTIKWIQSKLSARGYSLGRIDGKSGPRFEQAVDQFKRDNEMSDGSSIDDVIAVLKKPVKTTTAEALLSKRNVRK